MFMVRANDRMCSDVMVRANDRMCSDVYGARE